MARPLATRISCSPAADFDSLDAIEIIMCIETEYGINFAEINFDLTRLNSITAIADLVNRYPR